MNVFAREWKMNFKSSASYLFLACLLSSLMMSFYSLLDSDLKGFMDILDNFPAPMKAIMGIQIDLFTSPIGYYSFVFTFVSILFAIQSIGIGAGIFSKEIREKTADFLLTKPISRSAIFAQKISAAASILLLSGLLYSVIIGIVIYSFSNAHFDIGLFVKISLSFLIFQQTFLFIGTAISQILPKIKTVLPVAVGVGSFFYAISAFAVTSDDDKLRFLTPFQYNRPDSIVFSGDLQFKFIMSAIAVAFICAAFALLRFIKKDIHSVS